MKLFLLIGQSNMAGRGELNEVEPIRDPRCKMMRNGRFLGMSEPICFDRAIDTYYHSGVGLSASFAKCAAEYFDEEIGLIPCADGGTSLSDWEPGGLLYDHAVFQTRLAMRSGTLAGILWHQGESDSKTAESASVYGERFDRFITRLQADIGCNVPVVAGELGEYLAEYDNGKVKHYYIVNEQLHAYAASHDNFAVASAAGLKPKPDGLHFCSVSLREFGERYFAAYRTLIEK